MLTMPITWSSGVRGFVLPFVWRALAVSLSVIPVEEPTHGFQARNLNMIWMAVGAAFLAARTCEVRFSRLIPDSHLNSKQRGCCALTLAIMVPVLCVIFWRYFAFPFPFGKLTESNLQHDIV